MSKLILRAALAGCATAGLATAQTPPSKTLERSAPPWTTPAPIAVPPPVPMTTVVVRATPTQTKLVLKAFDVAELVCPPADSPLAKPGRDPAMIAAAKAFTEVRGEELLKIVRAATVQSGECKLDVTTDGRTLVASSSEAVTDKVGACLEALRKLRNSQVKVEMTVFTVPSGNEAMVKLFGDKPTAAVNGDEFNKVLRELKASGAVDILTRPTMVLLNKQTGFCQTGQAVPIPPVSGGPAVCETVGVTSRITPEVSADLRSVLLALELQHTQPACGQPGVSCVQSKTNVVLPDGGMMVVKVGTQKAERKIEQKVPVVSDIPYMGRLFKNVSSTTEPTDVVAVVTATRVADAACVAPPVALVPPMMPAPTPTAVPFSTPLAAPVPVMLPLPIRTVGADGLDRVGVSFTALTTPPPLQATPTFAWKAAPAGVSFTRFAPAETQAVAGAVIGVTVGGDDTTAMMAAYKAACASGRTDEAARLAMKLLANDPTCFGK